VLTIHNCLLSQKMPRSRRNLVAITFAVLVSIALTGCNPAVSLRPLATPQDKVMDPQIEGNWSSLSTEKGEKDTEVITWQISNVGDHYRALMSQIESSITENNPKENSAVYTLSLIKIEDKLFFDAVLDENTDDGHVVRPRDVEPSLVPVHLVGRIWLHPDYVRLAMLDSSWLREHSGEDFSETADSTAIITASTTELRKFLARNAEDNVAFSYGAFFCRQGQDCAPVALEDELRRRPDETDFLLKAAQFFSGRGNYARAVALLRHRTEVDPRSAPFHENLGIGLLFTHDFASARQEFQQGLSLAPNDLSLQEDVAWSYFLEGNFSQAAKAFAECVASGKNHSADPILGEYFSLLRLGRNAQADSVLAGNTAKFSGLTVDHALLLQAQGRASDGLVASSNEKERSRFALLEGFKWVAKNQPEDAAVSFKSALKDGDNDTILPAIATLELERLSAKKK